VALHDLDLAALDQAGEALEQALDDLVLVGVDPGMSTDSKVPFTPNWADSLMTSTVSAECRSALVGMQPRCRQVPPTLSFSIITTVMPSSAARRAAA